jgi:probable F420-dependent oxidoreductase
MRLGLFAINYNTCADPESCIRVARAAEAAGLDSVWTGEHLVLPSGAGELARLPSTTPMLDTIAAATWVAAHTSSIRIGTGVIVLPLHHPVLLAKQLASVDVLSDGRLIVGLAAGYIAGEFAAVDVPLEERGARMDEYVAALRALWTMRQPVFDGEFVSFRDVDAHPRPVQQPTPPLVFGGVSDAAFRRAVTVGHGWYGFNMTLDRTSEALEIIRHTERRYGRPPELGPLEIIVTPRDGQDVDNLLRYRDLGVDCVVALPADVARDKHHAPVPIDGILRTIASIASVVDGA